MNYRALIKNTPPSAIGMEKSYVAKRKGEG
jgi:hypothetical protein